MDIVDERETQRAETAHGDEQLHRERAAALFRLGVLEQKAGRAAEAERLFTEAVDVGETHLGADHPSIGEALNELSRLLIRQSAFDRAEPVLERLLAIARRKGERHADVATALAGLAAAKRGLGDHAAAEPLYRQALAIREEVLAPSHMGIVITMEQLSETCASRGNVAEALSLLQRALPRRECAVGADHPTVMAGRTRRAELERRLFEARLAELRRNAIPLMSAVVPIGAPVALPVAAAPAPIAPVTLPLVAVEQLASHQPASLEVAVVPVTRKRRTARWAAVSGSAAVALMAIVGFTLGSHNRTVSGSAPTVTSSEEHLALVSSSSSEGSSAFERASGAHAGLVSTGTTTSAATGTPATKVIAPVQLPSLRKVVIPKLSTPNPDSVMQISGKVARDAEVMPGGVGSALTTMTRADEPSLIPPVLIGSAPTPRFPDDLRARGVDGVVVVRFKVDDQGRVDPASMQVVRSPHELFTEAVRGTLARLRFQPARTTARDAKPQAAWVQLSTEFRTRN